eukprot:gene27794-biopygen5203
MQRQKRALLVSPSYATPGLDIRTRYVMEKTGVLPSDLGKYSTEGFARDAAVLRRQLGPGFSFETLEGEPLVDVEEVQKDEYGNVFFDADGSLVYTIVTTTQGPFVDPDTGETRTGEPLETPIPVTEPAYEMRWMATEIDASSGVSITTLISKEDYEKHTVYPLHIKTSVDNVSLFSVGDMVMYSDIRTKSDVLPIPDALERVGRLRGYTFIKNGGDETRRSCGLIAQELLDVLPEAVHANPESGMLTVAYGNVESLLVNAINELKAQVDTLSGT